MLGVDLFILLIYFKRQHPYFKREYFVIGILNKKIQRKHKLI